MAVVSGRYDVKLGLWPRLIYGFGAVAYGVKDNGFSYFLLLYYNQVLGVPAAQVAAAGFIALCVDAISDPIVGTWSDRLHSRWGRRHPFMYAAALPVALTYFFFWNAPQDLSQEGTFLYLVVMAILVRTTVTFYEIPSTAMAAELTDHYDERTKLFGYRYLFGWLGGLLIAALAFGVFLVPTEKYPFGLLNVEGYHRYGLVAALLMLAGIAASSVGTHRYIPLLMRAPPALGFSPIRLIRETFQSLATPSFLTLFGAAMFFAAAQGLTAALAYYFSAYFWGLRADQILLFIYMYVISSALAFVIAPRASLRIGKRKAAIVISILGFSLAPLSYTLRLLGLFPENGDPILLPLLLGMATVDVALLIAAQILVASMLADVVEESELKTGRRAEGLFFAARTFVYKIVSGLGLFMSGIILTVVEFPAQAVPGQVPPEVLRNLALVYAPTLFTLFAMSLLCLLFYRIDRDGHENNLARLRERAAAHADPPTPTPPN